MPFMLDVFEILLVNMDGCEPTLRYIAEDNALPRNKDSPLKERSACSLCLTVPHTLAQLEPNLVGRVHPRTFEEVNSVQKLMSLCTEHGEHVYPFLRVAAGNWVNKPDIWYMIHEDSTNELQYGQLADDEEDLAWWREQCEHAPL